MPRRTWLIRVKGDIKEKARTVGEGVFNRGKGVFDRVTRRHISSNIDPT